MRQLFLFFYNYRAFFSFLLLEVVSVWLIVENNQYQGGTFYNSANTHAASVLEFSNNVSTYFGLKDVNEELAKENAELRTKLERLNLKSSYLTSERPKPEVLNQYRFFEAKVINNTTRNVNNYITINKGLLDGIRPGMGVVGPTGVVGKVKNCSQHYSIVSSVLHFDVLISSQLKKYGSFCTTKWNGKNPNQANLIYLPKYVKVGPGDTVVTSGFNAVYPQGVLIGKVIKVRDDVQPESFDRITIKLATDFGKLSYVYVIQSKLKPEIDSLSMKIGADYE